ncbi:MAG: MBL fold metallo-hydrolase [Herpetosiphon sp.]
MALQARTFNDHISYFDNGLLQQPGIGTTYVVHGTELAIVEAGAPRCVDTILEGLSHLGHRPQDVRHIVLTHVHLDHAGGAPGLLQHMPEAQIYLHSLTIPHLIDPSRLMRSAEKALGAIFPLHGTMHPAPAERILPAENLRLDLGNDVVLAAVPTPGHSADHLAFHDLSSGALFTGDGIGVVVPAYDYEGPVSPPPGIDLVAQQQTFDLLLGMPLTSLLFTHWGPSTTAPRTVIGRLRDRFAELSELVQSAMAAGNVDIDHITRTMLGSTVHPPAAALIMVAWIDMSVRGLQHYYERRQAA